MENIIAFRPNKPQPVKVSELLRLYRARAKFTQKALAQRLDLQSDRMIKKWESGESLPEPVRLRKLIEVYLREGVFTQNHEKSEAQELWAVVQQTYELQSVTFETYNIFDIRWFDHLINEINSLPALPKQPYLPGQTGKITATVNQVRHNLPLPATELIGREKDCEQVKRLLAKGRLLTLTGSAGVGKSRLALAVARDLLPSFKDGVWLLNLSGEKNLSFEDLLHKLVGKMGPPGKLEGPDATLPDNQPQHLELLVVMDDCDTVIVEAGPVFDRLLRNWPGLKILATSREGLNIVGEHIYKLPPLGLYREEGEENGKPQLSSPVVQLFIERAEKILPGFKLGLTPAKEQNIARICRSLDEVPLAVELAARLVEGLSLEQIETRLEEPFNLLKMKDKRLRGASYLPLHRNSNLELSLDFSYNRLTPAEQTLLNRLVRLDDTLNFSLEQVEQLYEETGEATGQVMDLFYALLRKSLVEVHPVKGNRPATFFLLNIVRKYLLHHLKQQEEGSLLD